MINKSFRKWHKAAVKRRGNPHRNKRRKLASETSSDNPVLGYTSSAGVYSSADKNSGYKRLAARAAGAVVGYATGFGAVAGSSASSSIYDYMDEDLDNTLVPTKSMGGNAGYSGRFNKRTKPKSNFYDQSKRYGYHVGIETYGAVNDPNTVYVHHSTCQMRSHVKALMGAIIRKGFELAGMPVGNKDEELTVSALNLSSGLILSYITINPITAVVVETDYVVPDNATLNSVIDAFTAMDTHLFDYMRNGINTDPLKFVVYTIDQAPVLNRKNVASTVNIPNLHVKIVSSSLIKLQNRTLGDIAASTDLNTERSDNQPVLCYNFLLGSGDMRLKYMTGTPTGNMSENLLQGCALSGPSLIRAAEFASVVSGQQNAPSSHKFANCSKVGKSILQPGQMKQSLVYHKFSGLLVNVLKRMRCQVITNDYVYGIQGRSELIVIEEKMRTAGSNKVTISYEREYQTGCIIKVLKNTPLVSYLELPAVKNNVT